MTRESPWDDESRDRALRLAYDEDATCGCGCGLPITEAYRDQPFIVDTFTCYADKAMQRVRRTADENAKAEKKPDHWNDGLHYYVKPYDPEEDKRGN